VFTRRIDIRLDGERHARIAAEAERRGVAMAVVVRDAIDAAFPADPDRRADAGRAILAAPRMLVPDPVDLRREIGAAHPHAP
jgi:hypothetical protein